MERNDFLKSFGLGLALFCTGSCLSACGSKGNDPQPNNPGSGGPPAGTTANVDLTSQLLAVGASVVANGILFIRTATGNQTSSFVATQAACPHQGGSLNFIQSNNYIQCSLHASRYATTGDILTQPNDGGTTTALKVYATSVSGNTLAATV